MMEINPIFLGEQPENVWRLFSTICTIPHRSHLHGPMCRFLLDYARGHGLTAYVDAAHNVVVHKEASLGRENAPPLVLQAHYDMVCMAEEGVRFDFDKQALNLRRNGDKVYAEGTTLGGDDGIDVAIILDILGDSHAVHPSLEAVFTADEEDGMDGAFGLDCERLRGRLWINLDASPVKVSCFGSLSMSLRLRKTTEEIAKGSLILRLGIDGLQGGHSGNLATSERGNAIVLLNRALCKLRCQVPFQLVSIDGGVYGGAFPRTAEAVVAMDPDEHAKALEVIGQLQRDFQVEFAVRDPHVHVFLTPFDGKPVTAFSKDTLDRLLKLLLILPDGVFTHDHEYPDTAETSSNLGRIETFEKEILVLESIRSLIGAKKAISARKGRSPVRSFGCRLRNHRGDTAMAREH